MTPTGVQDYLTTSLRIQPGEFIFLVCQQGSEKPLKQLVLSPESPFRLAYSRPGLLTFKSSEESTVPAHPLIRQSGVVLKQVQLAETTSLPTQTGSGSLFAQSIRQMLGSIGETWDFLHVFERDRCEVGAFGFEPGASELVKSVSAQLIERMGPKFQVNEIAPLGSRVLDCIIVEPDRWIVGWHQVVENWQSWPGGVFPVGEPEAMISRAYLKMAEALAWSELPIEPGDRVVEIGSAPGGASQRLLDMGLQVTGIDPAEMNSMLLQHPRFEHWRSKSAAVRRKNYAKFKWLVADANVAPNYTLDCVGDIATYPTTKLRGLILTLKLSNYELLDQLDDYLNRIRGWGFSHVKARQLGHNRHEICVAAWR